MNRRAMFLEALGIPTEWVRRDAAGDGIAEEVAAEAPVAPAVTEVAVARTAIETVAPDPRPVEPAAVRPQAPRVDMPDEVDDAVELAATVEAFDAPDMFEPVRPAGQPQAQPLVRLPEHAGREAAIAAMSWPELADSVAGCTACGLCATRTNTVFGVGDTRAEWMVIGEAPGENEDQQGEPFVGQAGKLLDNMLGALGLARGRNVYIANVLKCRPPDNRDPQPDEVAQCEPYLKRQIALIKPKVIVVLGRFAAQSLLRSTTPIGKLRGAVHTYEGIPVVVTYHPAYLLRALTDKARAWEDLCLAREVHDRAGAQA